MKGYAENNRVVKITIANLFAQHKGTDPTNWDPLRHYLESLLGEYMTDWLFDWDEDDKHP